MGTPDGGQPGEIMSLIKVRYLQMNDLGLMEITELKPFALSVMDDLRKLTAVKEAQDKARENEDEEMMDDDDDL